MFVRILSNLKHACLLEPDQPVLVGVSGGPDSLCLLDLMWRLRYPVVVAHFNHGLRPEAETEADSVRKIAETLNVPFCLGKEDVLVFSEVNGLSLEESARNLRYRFLFQYAQVYNAQAVAVAHTADDQVETVLMHLLRGAGLSGLKGMAFRTLPNPWSDKIPLVRPLLGVWRDEVLAYTEANNLKPAFDPSNLDQRHYRNRLRHELIPFLKTYNPGVKELLWRTANILGEDYAVLEREAEPVWQACSIEQGPGYVIFNRENLNSQPKGLQRHLFRRAISSLRPGLRDIDFAVIDRALDFLAAPSRSGQADLAAGLRLFVEAEHLWLATWEADLPDGAWPQLLKVKKLSLEIPGKAQFKGGWLITAEAVRDTLSAREQAYANTDPYQAWVNADGMDFPLLIRARQPGDRFQPLGMGGHSMKLADFMVNFKLPRRARDNWPLISGSGPMEDLILWIPGYRLAHPFRLTPAVKSVIHLQLSRTAVKPTAGESK